MNNVITRTQIWNWTDHIRYRYLAKSCCVGT